MDSVQANTLVTNYRDCATIQMFGPVRIEISIKRRQDMISADLMVQVLNVLLPKVQGRIIAHR